MTSFRLADGEEIVRTYPCTAVDRVAMFMGTVVPVPGTVESQGTLTLTNLRILFELDAQGKRSGSMRRETRLSDVSSISSMMSKFGRDLRMPILCMLVGFLMMFVPYLGFTEAGAFLNDGDYEDGYNAGIEYGYFSTYMSAVQDGKVSHTIPDEYYFYPEELYSNEYARGYNDAVDLGIAEAEKDIVADAPFSVPEELMLHSDAATITLMIAIVGAVIFVTGSLLYLVSNRTKDWIVLDMGAGGPGIYLTSVGSGWRSTGYRALTAEDQYWDMTRELGSAIVDIRFHKETRLRFFDDDEPIIEPQTGWVEREEEEVTTFAWRDDDDVEETTEEAPTSYEQRETRILERAPEIDDDMSEDGVLIIDDDDEDTGPRIVGPWREEE